MNPTEWALIVTNVGTLAAALATLFRAHRQRALDAATIETVEADLARRYNNRRIQLERYADDVSRYHRGLRDYLLELVDQKVIDVSRVDMSRFPPPPIPIWLGNGGK